MDFYGLATEQIREIHNQQARQACFSGGFGGLIGGALGSLTAGLAAQNVQRSGLSPFGGPPPQHFAQSFPFSERCKPRKTRKVRDYSEHLTQKEEKIPAIGNR